MYHSLRLAAEPPQRRVVNDKPMVACAGMGVSSPLRPHGTTSGDQPCSRDYAIDGLR